LQAVYPDIKSRGGELVVVSPEIGKHSADMAGKQSLTFPILSDHDLYVAEAFGIAVEFPDDLIEVYKGFGLDLPARNGMSRWALPMPARFVIGRDGRITFAYVDPDYTRRPDPAETVAAI
jgi:peroxiredoxin